MKRTMLLLFAVFFMVLFFTPDDEEPVTVTYEVITENDAPWSGEFVDANGDRILTFSLDGFFSETEGHKMPCGWKYTFSPAVQPIELLIAASTLCVSCGNDASARPSITANIYINGKLIWTETDDCRECTATNLKGNATSWFKFPEEWND
jgi:hypothetical protein